MNPRFAVAVTLFLFMLCGRGLPPAAAALVGHWDFDEAAGDLVLDSAGSNHGTNFGATRIAGRLGSGALQFDGLKSYVLVGGIGTPLDLVGTPYSIAFWMRATGSTGQQFQRLITKDDGADFVDGYSVHLDGGELEASHNTGPNQNWDMGFRPNTQWVHIAVTFGSGFRRLYTNGVMASLVATTGLLTSDGNDPLIFGAIKAPGIIQFFKGDLDDVRMYNHTLSVAELMDLAHLPVLTFKSEPVAQVAIAGHPASFSGLGVVRDQPAAVIAYQWERDGVEIPGANQATYLIPAVVAADDGAQLRLVARFSDEAIFSKAVRLTVLPSANLLGHWDFEEGSGNQALDSAGTNHGVIDGAVYVPGRIGQTALHFNGSNSVVRVGAVGTALALAGTPYSLSWWQRWAGPTGHQQGILSMDDGMDHSAGYSVSINPDQMAFSHDNGMNQDWFSAHPTGAWQHFALVWNGQDRALYVDGRFLDKAATTNNLKSDGDDPLWFGALQHPPTGAPDRYFQGDLDDIRIYQGVLSESEISALASLPEVTAISVLNPSFEQLTGADSLHFDASGHLLSGHYSSFDASQMTESGFFTLDAIPSWTGLSGGTVHPQESVFLNGVTDGQNSAWLSSAGHISQILAATFLSGSTYRLSVDIGAPAGLNFPGYVIGLYADGHLVAEDSNNAAVPPGGFATATVEVALPSNSPFAGTPIEIRLGIPGSQPEQTDFDNVRLTMSTVSPLPECAQAPGGLVAWYRAENGIDDELGANPGLFAHPQYAEGLVGRAFDFDGTNEVVIPDAPGFDSGNFTLEAWVFPTSLDGTVDLIANKESGSELNLVQYEIGIKGPTNGAPNQIPLGNVAFFLGGVAGLPNEFGGWVDGKAAAPLNQWTHVALTVQPGSASVYVNGIETRRLDSLVGTVRSSNGPLKIGSRSDSFVSGHPWDRFNGRIDEFGFYGRALAPWEIAAVFRAGSAGKCGGPFPIIFIDSPASLAVVAGADVTFNAAATGSPLLSYQWKFNGNEIVGATNTRLVLPGARRNAQGTYTVTVCNPSGCLTTDPATLTVLPGPAIVRVVPTSIKSSDLLAVPIELVANGNENGLSFSLRFDQNRLTFLNADLAPGAAGTPFLVNSAKASNGVVGVVMALPAGGGFPEGTNDLLRINFSTRVSSVDSAVFLQLTDNPTQRQLSDAGANLLPVTWVNGVALILASDYEGDVSPSPGGDKQVDLRDWVQVGRFVAGLDEITGTSQFQRADCAPLSTAGNGRLTVSDWVQTGRFAVGLDPLAPAAGPVSPLPDLPGKVRARPLSDPPVTRVISLTGGEIQAGTTKEFTVLLAASGDENAVAFSLHYDPAVLSFVGVTTGSGSLKATLNVNTKQAAAGRVGLALALTTGATLEAGMIEIAKLRFAAVAGAKGPTNLSFVDVPVFREVASPLAETLPAAWQDLALSVLPLAVSVSRVQTAEGPAVVLAWPAALTGAALESVPDLGAGPWGPVNITPVLSGDRNTVTLPPGAASGYFRLRLQ